MLLRLKALTGDADPEVCGECFVALLELDPPESVTFVHRFAVGALANDLRRAIVFSCAASPLADACDFLVSIVADRHSEAAVWALSALASSRFRGDVKERARDAAQKSADVQVIAACEREFERR
jgi:hypothetical protein